MHMFGIPKMLGFRYRDGKILIYRTVQGNPKLTIDDKPAWAVDIREIIAMFFVGIAAICFINKGEHDYAMTLLVGLLGYATGRTVTVKSEARQLSFELSGTVVEKWSRVPVRGASVTMASRVVTTDSSGRFAFRAVPLGTYKVTVIHRSYDPFTAQWSFTRAGAYDVSVIELTPIVAALRR